MRHFMSDNGKAILARKTTPEIQADSALPPEQHSVVLQGTFGSDADREEFVQTITRHGFASLYCTKPPTPLSSDDDLNFIEKLVGALIKFRARRSKMGNNHDAG
jgi:hypothetical protein